MAKIHGGQIIARALKAEGVDVLFTLTGGHILPILDGCVQEGIRIVDVRHEQPQQRRDGRGKPCRGSRASAESAGRAHGYQLA